MYSRSGVGKTTTLRTMPGNGLVIDVPALEGRTFVLAGCTNIDIRQIETWDDLDAIFWFLQKENHIYRWVAPDTITAMQILALRKVTGRNDVDLDDAQERVTLPQWGDISALVGELVYKFRTLKHPVTGKGLHTLWMAQERVFGRDNQPREIGPGVLPGARDSLVTSLLLVGRLFLAQGPEGQLERHMRVQPTTGYYCKATTNPFVSPLPAVIRNVNFATLLPYMIAGAGDPPEGVAEPVFNFGA